MVLCYNCERLNLPTVSRGLSSEKVPLSPNVRTLKRSAKTCDLCKLFVSALSNVRMKGLENGSIKLQTWASDALGDPIGISRVFVTIGDSVGRFVDISIEEGNPTKEAGVAIGRNLPSTFASDLESRFRLYRGWLSNCLENHPGCHDSCAKTFFPDAVPDRFLQVSSIDGLPLLRLIQGTAVEAHEYAALSHCWGGHGGLETHTASLESHMDSIHSGLLSKTVSDAVAITRGLGLKYLWVDTLCIVQDDKQDWNNASFFMDQVYRNAVVTIAASSAKNGREGCALPSMLNLEAVKAPFTMASTTPQKPTSIAFRLHTGSIAEGFEQSTLSDRGWCLQEAVLSRRILHFRNDRVIWQCRECLTTEDYVHLRNDQANGYYSDRSYRFSMLPLKLNLHDWFLIVEEYSRRKLTLHKDKLFAMEGLTAVFSYHIKGRCESGIWFKLIDSSSCLLWISATGEMRTPPSLRAPSWSWAALDGPIYHFQTLRSLEVSRQPTLQILEHVGSDVIFVPEPSQGSELANGHLVIQAPICHVFRSDHTITASKFNLLSSKAFQDLLYNRRDMKCHELLDAQGESCGWASLDQESFVREDIHCLLVSTVTLEKNFEAYDVVILREDSDDGKIKFSRIGVGEITRKDFFNGEIQPSTVILR